MSKFELFEGCHVQLRNGKSAGPLKATGYRFKAWECGYREWYRDGSFGILPHAFDIVRVVDLAQREPKEDLPEHCPCEPFAKSVPDYILKAARDAGLKAQPAYDEFVSAIVEAAFAAARVGFDTTPTRLLPGSIDALRLQFDIRYRLFKTTKLSAESSREAAHIALDVVMETLDRVRTSQNESESTIRPAENSKGGQSDIEHVRGANLTSSPVDESGQGSGFETRPASPIYSLSKVHPATREFLQSIYPHAPLRAVSLSDNQTLIADYGWPMNVVATITVSIEEPAVFPHWIGEVAE